MKKLTLLLILLSLNFACVRPNKIVAYVADGANVLLFVAVNDRQWRIQITNNLETKLPNELLTDLSTPMTASFKQDQYGEGIEKYVEAVTAKLTDLNSR